jgi:hypothetical protein
VLLAAAVALAGFVHGQMPTRTRASRGEVFVPRPELARATAFGFDAVIADYYWFQAIQVVGRGNVQDSIQLGQLVDVVTTLDPWVDHPYRFAAVWMMDSEANVRKANELLRRGIAHHPDDWRNHFHLGFNLFFLLDEPAAAADSLEEAIALPGSPAYLRRLVARLRGAGGSLETAASFLYGLALEAPSDEERAAYEGALLEIETERVARTLDEARARYRERHGRDLSAPEDLLAGPEPILAALPRDPSGGAWILDPANGEIVSDVVKHRYRAKIDLVNRRRIERVRAAGKPDGEGT